MVAIRMEDSGNMTSRHISGQHCLLCGEVVEPGIAANRIGHHEPTRDRTRPRYLAGTKKVKHKLTAP
jgi:hypothetical protein